MLLCYAGFVTDKLVQIILVLMMIIVMKMQYYNNEMYHTFSYFLRLSIHEYMYINL